MSRGHGSLQRQIECLLRAEGTVGLSVRELTHRIYQISRDDGLPRVKVNNVRNGLNRLIADATVEESPYLSVFENETAWRLVKRASPPEVKRELRAVT